MKKMKKVVAFALAMSMALGLSACGGGNDSSNSGNGGTSGGSATSGTYDEPEFKLQLGHSDTTTNLIHISLENFADYVYEQSNGRVEITIYAAEQLGSNAEMAEAVQMGSLDAMMMPQGQVCPQAECSGPALPVPQL